jgi:predicted dehydrogenase
MGLGHLKNIKALQDCVLTAVSDAVADVAHRVGKENNVRSFSDYREMLRSGLIDAVLVATPHYFHAEVGIAAFQNGLHVLTEKPLAVNVSAADKFLAAARKGRKVFAVMYQERTLPAVRAARKIIEEGRLGEIRRTLMVDPHYRSQAYYDSAGWRGTWKGEGGGVLMNQAPHGIDLFLLLGGLPCRVTAKTRTRLHKIEVEDEAHALLEYKNGAWGYYCTSTCEPADEKHKTARMEICGDKGTLIYSRGELTLLKTAPPISEHNATNREMWAAPKVEEEKIELPGAETGHKEILRNFCETILGKEKLMAPGEQGLWSTEFINAMILSGKTGKPVDIPVDRARYDKLLGRLQKTSKDKKVKEVKRVTDPKFQ